VVNVPGSALLGSATAILSGNVSMAPMLTPGTSLASLNLGAGWQPGSISITDGNGQNFVVNLGAATDVADVISIIQTATAGAITAAIAADGEGLQLTGTGPLTVAEVDGNGTALSLGLLGTAADGNLVGSDIRAEPTAATPLTEVAALAGSLPLGAININRAGGSVTVDFSTATTLGDLQAAVAAAVPGIELRLVGGLLALVSDSTISFEVTNAPGSTAASDLGLVGSGTPARLFGVFEDVRAALEAHDRDALRALFAEMGAVEDGVLGLLVKTGGREVLLDWMKTILQTRDEQLQANRSRERDADLIESASELSKAEAAYQASLLAASRLFEVNLMSYLR
jgi:flagellin-like hook-associated protein FlgL